mmetsp:Transcript_13948/g.33780  ORF Transcript_13948/g.33780 Transcript_13948/m.33780 type:complete len:107 (-) Transcript_13948:158-478(-)
MLGAAGGVGGGGGGVGGGGGGVSGIGVVCSGYNAATISGDIVTGNKDPSPDMQLHGHPWNVLVWDFAAALLQVCASCNNVTLPRDGQNVWRYTWHVAPQDGCAAAN